MPRGRRKSGDRSNGGKVQMSTSNDVTVYDFAHAETPPQRPTIRMKKGATNAIKTEVKQLSCCPSQETPALAWYEKDLDDFNLLENGSDEVEDEEARGEEPTATDDQVLKISSKKKKKSAPLDDVLVGVVYPLDLWFLVSIYVEPEDVSRFARICTGTHYVVHTAQFWRRLYERSYDPAKRLPPSLEKTSMERLQGLRARVIRALQVMHPPFVERYKMSRPFEDKIYDLEGYKCVVMWHEKVKNIWNFYFKFHREASVCKLVAQLGQQNGNHFSPRRVQKRLDLINGFNDIHDNIDNGCSVLKVTCQNFSSFPVIMGMVLNKVYLNVSQGMRFHRLRLMFDTHRVRDMKHCCTGVTVILDPVMNAKVLHWWDPHFPSQG